MLSGFTTANARPDLIVRAAARAVSVFAPAQAGGFAPRPPGYFQPEDTPEGARPAWGRGFDRSECDGCIAAGPG